MATKCTKWPQDKPNGCQIFQMDIKYTSIFQSKALPQKCTQIGISGLKRYHLATLLRPTEKDASSFWQILVCFIRSDFQLKTFSAAAKQLKSRLHCCDFSLVD
jgi:hypothetical protein